jgi:hypothetical protein
MAPTFVVYIDESGDEGFVFRDPPDKGSSDWFVLSALIAPQQDDANVRQLAAAIRTNLRLEPKHVLHFSALDHERRVRAICELGGSQFKATSVIVNKRAIRQPEIFRAAP